jgi:hypothetical protein
MSKADMAAIGGVHATTLSRYLSEESELQPGTLWTLSFVEQLIRDYEVRRQLLERLHRELAEQFQEQGVDTQVKQLMQYLRDLGARSLERPDVTDEEIEAYINAPRGIHPLTQEGWDKLFERESRQKKRGKKSERKRKS